MLYGDKIEFDYRNLDEFINRLNEVELSTQWQEVEIEDLDVGKNLMDLTEADRDTNLKGTGMFMKTNWDTTPIRECALRTLYTNLGLGGELMKKFDNEDLEEYIVFGIGKNRKHRQKLKFKVPVIEGKVNAFLSEGYVNIPAKEVFEEVLKHFQEKTLQNEFKFNGHWSYAQCSGEYFLPIKREVDGEEYSIVLVVRTSDAGYSSVNLSAYLYNGNDKIPVMNDLSMIHKGNTDKSRLEEMLNMTDNAINKGVDKLNKLLHVTISNPKGCMKRVAKEVGLPKKETLKLIEEFINKETSAFECYLCLTKLLQNEELLWSVKERYQGNIYKLLGINWSAYDLPGDYAW